MTWWVIARGHDLLHDGGMTTTHVPITTTTTTTGSAERNLRRTLLVNTTLSVLTGAAALVAGGPVADLLGVDQVWLIRLLGAGLLAFAAGVFLAARSDRDALITWSLEISIADFAWVAGTIAVVALGWLSTTGVIVMAIVGADVLTLGTVQLLNRSRMT